MNKRIMLLAIAAPVAWAAHAWAGTERADPADPARAVRPLRFDSAMGERNHVPEVDPPARWRTHNDRVRVLGGHTGHARAGAGEAAPLPTTSPANEPKR